jgi:hypothetical protein
MQKRQKGINVKERYEFGNDLMKMYFKHKIRMKVDHKINNIKIV